jgi:hypothetical protein
MPKWMFQWIGRAPPIIQSRSITKSFSELGTPYFWGLNQKTAFRDSSNNY